MRYWIRLEVYQDPARFLKDPAGGLSGKYFIVLSLYRYLLICSYAHIDILSHARIGICSCRHILISAYKHMGI